MTDSYTARKRSAVDNALQKLRGPKPRLLIEPACNGFVVYKNPPSYRDGHAPCVSDNPYVFENIGALNNFLLKEYSDE